jgi:hypothetical protein
VLRCDSGDWRDFLSRRRQLSKSARSAIDGTFTNDEMAIMGKSQIIHTDGEDLVVTARGDYEALLARAGEEASEDAMTALIVDSTDAKIARGEGVALPAAVWDAIESDEHSREHIRQAFYFPILHRLYALRICLCCNDNSSM